MKNVCTFLVAFFALSISLFGWSKGSYMKPDLISNPYNDQEIIFTDTKIQSNELSVCKIDLITGKSILKKLALPNYSTVFDAVINGNSRAIGYLLDGKIIIFNYDNFTEIANFPLNYSGDSQDTKVCFSKDGSLVYTLKKSELRLSIYEVSSGTKLNQFLLNANPAFYSAGYLNSEKDEFALVKNDSLEIYAISNGNIVRTIPFDSKAELVQFRNSGNEISYKVGNTVHIVNSLTGEEIFNKTISLNFKYLEFSANMKYMICRVDDFDQTIWDIESDTLITEGLVPDKSGFILYFNYINSTKTRTVGFIKSGYMCSGPAPMPTVENFYFLFDIPSYKPINSIGDGYIGNPREAIINPTNDLILVSSFFGDNDYPVLIHGLVSGDGEFLKYIHVQRSAIAFSHDSKYIAFNDTTRLLLYNIEKDKVEKTLQTKRSSLGKIFFSPQNGGLIISITKDYIDVYDYNTLTLNFTKNLTAESGYGYSFVCDINGYITILYPSGRYFKFDAVTGDLSEVLLNNLPANRTFSSMTNDGRYILWSIGKDSIDVYDVKFQNIKFSYKNPQIGTYSDIISISFLGNHEIILYSYINNPVDKWNEFYAYDLVEKKIIHIAGEGYPRVSIDGTKYVTLYCPFTYTYNSIRPPVSIREELSSEVSLQTYPNPTTDYINIDLSFLRMQESTIEIFDVFGNRVFSVETQNFVSLPRIDVSALPPGVYFVKIGNEKQIKFVKM